MTPETLPDHLKYSEKVRDDLLRETNRRKIKNMPTMPYILGFSGSAVYLKMTEPGLFKRKEFFGIESPDEANYHEEKLKKYDSTLKTLKGEITVTTVEGQNFLQKIDETEVHLLALYSDYTSALDEKIMTAALRETPQKHQKALSSWISASLEEMKAMKKRDQKIAEAIYANDGSTVVTVGHGHLDSVASMLANKCKKDSTVGNSEPAKKVLKTGTQ